MKKKVLIITGIGKGFGRQLLINLSRSFFVIGVTRSTSDIDKIISDHPAIEGSCQLIPLDLTSHDDIFDRLVPVLEKHKDNIYGLINNAGIRCRKSLLDATVDDMISVISANTIAPMTLIKVILPFMIAQGVGRIINVSSILAKASLPDLSIYITSKGALSAFSRAVACEYAKYGITCNAILPGFCETSYFDNFSKNVELYQMTLSRIPAARWGSDNELVGVCSFLLSPDAQYINGAEISVDGGWLS